jgi:phosphatidylglycerol---prolipoprotein diacylglyceryl transferase
MVFFSIHWRNSYWWWFGRKIIIKKFKNTSQKFNIIEFDDLISYLIISIIIGGRVGYIIFYNLEYYILNPLDVIKIWEGGMSFHGALIGVIIGTYFFSAKKKISAFFLLDVIACASPIGIFFGRIANFINGELIGKVTNVSWGVIFPNIDMLARHPSQLYEAFLEGIVLFFILNAFILKKNYKTGTCSFLFLIFYGFFRIFSEVFREPDSQVGYFFDLFSMGTSLSFFMIFSGVVIFFIVRRNEI